MVGIMTRHGVRFWCNIFVNVIQKNCRLYQFCGWGGKIWGSSHPRIGRIRVPVSEDWQNRGTPLDIYLFNPLCVLWHYLRDHSENKTPCLHLNWQNMDTTLLHTCMRLIDMYVCRGGRGVVKESMWSDGVKEIIGHPMGGDKNHTLFTSIIGPHHK